jgi:hypothetical protein
MLMRRIRCACCARAANGHAAAPPIAVISSRRPTLIAMRPSLRGSGKDTMAQACGLHIEKAGLPVGRLVLGVPNIRATSPEVGGTVDSHIRTVTAPNAIAAGGLAGKVMNPTTVSARPK